jgi:aminodeoxyfutalosine deaminase
VSGDEPLTSEYPRWIRPEWLLPLDSPPLAWPLIDCATGGVSADVRHRRGGEAVDLPGTVVLPLLVNCHTHLDLSLIPEPLGRPGQLFAKWVQLAIEYRRSQANAGGDQVRLAIDAGKAESQAAGVGLLGNICGAPWVTASQGGGDPAVVEFLEQLGTASSTGEARTEAIRNRLAKTAIQSSSSNVGLSPHAPYSLDRPLFFRTLATALQRRMPVAMHLAESQDELELLDQRRGPLWDVLGGMNLLTESPEFVSIRECLVALGGCERSMVVHGNYLDEAGLDLIALHRDRMSLVYCPRTHAYFGHRPWPMQAALKRGIRVVFGTDSRATSPNLDLLEDLQLVARQFPSIAPRDVLRMGTLAGSSALGVDQPSGLIAFRYATGIGKEPEAAVLARRPESRVRLGRGRS